MIPPTPVAWMFTTFATDWFWPLKNPIPVFERAVNLIAGTLAELEKISVEVEPPPR